MASKINELINQGEFLLKRILGIALVSALAAGIFGASNMVSAATDGTASSNTSASTDGSVTFEAGTLSLTNTTDATTFPTATVQDVYLNGYTEPSDKKMAATVNDFLGAENSVWTLTVSRSAWSNGNDSTDSLNTDSTLSLGGKTVTTTGAVVDSGKAGQTVVSEDKLGLTLNINKGISVTAGTHTNTLTWALTDPAEPNQN